MKPLQRGHNMQNDNDNLEFEPVSAAETAAFITYNDDCIEKAKYDHIKDVLKKSIELFSSHVDDFIDCMVKIEIHVGTNLFSTDALKQYSKAKAVLDQHKANIDNLCLLNRQDIEILLNKICEDHRCLISIHTNTCSRLEKVIEL